MISCLNTYLNAMSSTMAISKDIGLVEVFASLSILIFLLAAKRALLLAGHRRDDRRLPKQDPGGGQNHHLA